MIAAWTMKKSRLAGMVAGAILAVFAADAGAQQPKSQADSWGIQNEEATVLVGKVVDLVCELAKDCPAQCGAGKRQLGLLTAAGKLVLVAKNTQPLFTGAVIDLLPYCQKQVEMDGLMTGNDDHKVFQIQLIRERNTEKWNATDQWTLEWQKNNPTVAGSFEEWFYHDPRVAKQIDKNGYLGLGEAADRAFLRTQ